MSKLSADFFRAHERVVFQPKDARTAEEIQKRLFALGVYWGNERHAVAVQKVDECVQSGMTVWNGEIYYGVSTLNSTAVQAKLEDLPPVAVQPPRPVMPAVAPPQTNEELARAVDGLTRRLAALEARFDTLERVEEKLDRLLGVLDPGPLPLGGAPRIEKPRR